MTDSAGLATPWCFPRTNDDCMSDHNTKEKGPPPKAAVIGKRVGLVIVLLVLLYLNVVGFVTVIHGAFFQGVTSTTLANVNCSEALDELTNELTGYSSARMAPEEAASEDRTSTFFESWDEHFVHLRSTCESHPAYGPLERFRHRHETTLRRFDREDRVLLQRVQDALEGN